jgi:hypothetical protein
MPSLITEVMKSLADEASPLTTGPAQRPILSKPDPEPGELVPGDHLVTGRGLLYTHHGLYVGDHKVVHYAGWHEPFVGGKVEEIAIADFHNGEGFYVERYMARKYSNEESVRRIYRRLGENNYWLLFNNCEHLVRWAILGQSRCEQFKTFLLRWARIAFENEVVAKTRSDQIKLEYERYKSFVDQCNLDLNSAIEVESRDFVNKVLKCVESMEMAIERWDSDGVIKSVAHLADFYGEKLQYSSQHEFDALMANDELAFKL